MTDSPMDMDTLDPDTSAFSGEGSGDLLSTTTDSDHHLLSNYNYVLVPILLLEMAFSIFSNSILLILIGRSRKSMTILNIFLLSLSVLNLILTVNQVILLGLLLNHYQSIPHQICHVTFGIQALGNHGITLIQLVISYNRYRTTKTPIQWESNLKQAWITTGVVWIVAVLIAALDSILHLGGIDGDIQTCFWPRIDENVPFKLAVKLCIFIFFVCSAGVAAYYHTKSIIHLKENNATLAREMEMTSEIQYYESGHSTPEKTAKALVILFAVQMLTLLVHQVYDTIRTFMITVNWAKTGVATDPSPTFVLLLLTTFALSVTTVPSLLMIISKRFKKNVMSMFKCKFTRNVYLRNTNRTPKDKDKKKDPTPPPPAPPTPEIDLSIFIGANPASKYRCSGPPAVVLENRAIEVISLETHPERCTSVASEGQEAVDSGLVVASSKHQDNVKEVFPKTEKETTEAPQATDV